MITYGSIYLIAKDFEKSISFYRALFQKEVHAQNKTRFAVFDINGLTLYSSGVGVQFTASLIMPSLSRRVFRVP